MSVKPISDREFSQFQRLIYRSAGIHLSSAKKPLLEARLAKRIRNLGLDSFSAYYEFLHGNTGNKELGELLDRIVTNETHFFREPRQFDFLDQVAFPKWHDEASHGARPKHLRIWSAGCATGEEPFSIAMALLTRFPIAAGWQVDVFATDLSGRALDAARTAVWPIAKAREIPPAYLKRFMLRGTASQQGRMKAGPELQSAVRFEQLNLHQEILPAIGIFDLILCRNVLIYFDAASRACVIDRLQAHLAPDGYLFVGHAEGLTATNERLRYIAPTVYRKTESELSEQFQTAGADS